MSFYRTILKRAWDITWHNKYLWFFGLFVALLGNGGAFEIIFQSPDVMVSKSSLAGFKNIVSTGVFSRHTFSNILKLFNTDTMSLFLVFFSLLIMLALIIFLIWLVIVSQGALIHNVIKKIKGEKHNFKNGLNAGAKKFWPIFGLNLVLKLIIYLVLALLGLILIMMNGVIKQTTLMHASFLFVAAFFIFAPFVIISSFIIEYAVIHVIAANKNFIDSIIFGWKLFIKNWLISLEMALILFAINFLVGLSFFFCLMVLSIPFIFLALFLAKLSLYLNFFIFLISMLIIVSLGIILIGAILATFQTAAWTNLYIELTSRGGTSKLVRIFNKE